jgi:butyryl-CoA dehydrogenase
MTIGAAWPALEVATTYTTKRKAFGQVINRFQGVSFQIADAAMLLDASRAFVYSTCLAVQHEGASPRVRRLVSETKKFVTESCQQVVHNAMQVMGGIGYTNVFPIERIHRDLRLASIWTGTNEVMSAIAGSEWYKEHEAARRANASRDLELDAVESGAVGEKIYE